MSLPYLELAIAGSVLGIGVVELLNLRRLRKLREAQEAGLNADAPVAPGASNARAQASIHPEQGPDVTAES